MMSTWNTRVNMKSEICCESARWKERHRVHEKKREREREEVQRGLCHRSYFTCFTHSLSHDTCTTVFGELKLCCVHMWRWTQRQVSQQINQWIKRFETLCEWKERGSSSPWASKITNLLEFGFILFPVFSVSGTFTYSSKNECILLQVSLNLVGSRSARCSSEGSTESELKRNGERERKKEEDGAINDVRSEETKCTRS